MVERRVEKVEWASLPLPVAFPILESLLESIDRGSFTAVCKQRRSLAKDYNQATQRSHNTLPVLLIPSEYQGENSLMYSIAEGKIYNNFQPQVPFTKRCCGSSHGWLATIEDHTREGLVVALRNPFRKVEPICLPPLKVSRISPWDRSYFEFDVPKVVLSADPALNPKNYVVAAIYSSCLAFIQKGEDGWTSLSRLEGCLFNDVAFYRSQIYAVGRWGHVVTVYVNNFNTRLVPQTRSVLTENCSFARSKGYVVESTKGDLLYIRRFCKTRNDGDHTKLITKSFKVHKLVINKDGSVVEQVEVKSIGDEALLVVIIIQSLFWLPSFLDVSQIAYITPMIPC